MDRSITDISSEFTLRNGALIPCIGLGTWKMPDDVAAEAVINAVASGCRHVDTAAAYCNETGIGRGVRKCGVKREELFVTSKLPNSDHGYEKTIASFEESLKRMQLDYLDLYLIHWPIIEEHKEHYEEDIKDTWRAFEKLYEDGKVRAIGVSNFLAEHLQILLDNGHIKPMVNQVQFNPQCIEDELLGFCNRNGIIMEGWSPLIQGKAFEHQILKDMAEKYGKTVAQICIRFVLQYGVIPLPKSTNRERIANNMDVFDFKINGEDMERIAELRSCGRVGKEPSVPRQHQVVGF